MKFSGIASLFTGDCNQNTDVDVVDSTVMVCTNATPPECRKVDNGHHSRLRCGAYWEGGGGLLLGAEALGAGLVAGSIGVGAAAAAGVFDDDDRNKQLSPSK